MRYLKNLYRAILIVAGLVRYRKTCPKNVREANETYPGLNGHETPMKAFYPKKPSGHTIIIYPGASPHAEEHPGMITVGRSMARAGYLAFLPRIPLLKQLRLEEEILDWVVHFYTWLLTREGVEPGRITPVGMSFGGALILKASLDQRLQEHPPRSLFVYGTHYDLETALSFLLTGKMEVDGTEVYVKPHEWGLVVLFYNYLPKVDVGYDTSDVQRILGLRVKDLPEEVEAQTVKLSGMQRDLVTGILKGRATPEIVRITDLFWEQCRPEMESISPNHWCERIETRVFVFHGANDSMCPFTESIRLADGLKNSRLLISYLYEHREISTRRGLLFRLKEFSRIIAFMLEFIRYNEQKGAGSVHFS